MSTPRPGTLGARMRAADGLAPTEPELDGEHLLAEHRAATEELRHLRTRNVDLLELLRAWEPRVICPQCGSRYTARACGPTHAVVAGLLEGDR